MSTEDERIRARKEALLCTFRDAGSAEDRLQRLVRQARAAPPPPETLCHDEHLVEGCVARVWFAAECRDGRCWYLSHSESMISKALAGLLCEFYSGLCPADILATPPLFLREAGLGAALTANRRNAVSRIWGAIRDFAERQQGERA